MLVKFNFATAPKVHQDGLISNGLNVIHLFKDFHEVTVPLALANKNTLSAVFSYVSDKLTLKAPPAKDKTIRRFPFRTSMAAVLSAVIACTLAISYGSAALRSSGESYATTVEASEIQESATEKPYTTQK